MTQPANRATIARMRRMSRRQEDEETERDYEFEDESRDTELAEILKRPQRIVVEKEEGDDYE